MSRIVDCIMSNKISISVAENSVQFKEPVVVEYWPRQKEDGLWTIHYDYDFGMADKFVFSEDVSWNNISSHDTDEEIIRKTVEFDLAHAFDHPCEDPNYTHTHWALYGNLKNRLDKILDPV